MNVLDAPRLHVDDMSTTCPLDDTSTVGITIINHPFGNGLYQLSMVICVMVYYCYTHIMCSFMFLDCTSQFVLVVFYNVYLLLIFEIPTLGSHHPSHITVEAHSCTVPQSIHACLRHTFAYIVNDVSCRMNHSHTGSISWLITYLACFVL